VKGFATATATNNNNDDDDDDEVRAGSKDSMMEDGRFAAASVCLCLVA
jgi:hypothetical protein